MNNQVKHCPFMISKGGMQKLCKQRECGLWIEPHDNKTLFYGCALKVIGELSRGLLMPIQTSSATKRGVR